MGRRKAVAIGRTVFETQTEALEFVRSLLDGAEWGKALQGEEHEFVNSLLDRHPRASIKRGSGITHFTVDNDGHGSRCFFVHRTDKTREHFSYLKSVTTKDDVSSLVIGALNRAVDLQIWRFRDQQLSVGTLTCPFTSHVITKDSYHVDHAGPTFLELCVGWMKERGLEFVDVLISDGLDNEIGRKMSDAGQMAAWQQYHLAHARLRMLSPLGNLSGAKIEANRRRRQGEDIQAWQ